MNRKTALRVLNTKKFKHFGDEHTIKFLEAVEVARQALVESVCKEEINLKNQVYEREHKTINS